MAQDEASTGASGTQGARGAGIDPAKRRRFALIAVVVVAAVVAAAAVWWLIERNYESTDDAFIDTHIVRLAPQAAGRVTQVSVSDNQLVHAGQSVLTIDSADVAARVAQAKAQLAQASSQADNAAAQITIDQAALKQAEAELAAAKAPADNAAADLARYRRLAALNALAVSQQQIDQATSTARQTAAQRDATARSADSRVADIVAARTQLAAAKAAVNAAEAQLDENNVLLGYTHLVAPVAGHVTAKSVALGDYVQPGTQVLAIVPLTVWVTGNFKETQLKLMRPGQSVSIKVDACPENHLRGHVDSIQRGAGQAFGVLPAENATGNYVKVVQRVPVKIVFDEEPQDCILGPGMSVEPTVRVR